MLMTTANLGLVPTLLVVLAAGTAFGALQGLISIRFRLEPFIVTLAGLQMARGLALILSGNVYINISYGDGPGPCAAGLRAARRPAVPQCRAGRDAGVRRAAIVATVVLNTTRFGRYVFAVGGNERAARLSGIPVARVKVAVFRDHRICFGGGRHRPCRTIQFRQRQRRRRL